MTLKSLGITSILAIFLISCGNQYKFELSSPKELHVDKKLSVSIKEKNNQPADSIRYYLDGQRLATNTDIDVSKLKLGKHAISATIFFDDKQKQLTNTLVLLSNKSHVSYTYEIINEYVHDDKAFTQGLEYHNGYLYETTGQYGESSLRKVNIETGEVVLKRDLDKKYFGEGMTIYNDNIYVLTWRSKKGLVFDLESFEPKGEFYYGASQEGWGLTHNKNSLIKSDGTERIWFLDPNTQKEKGYIEAYTSKDKIEKLNELEYINGKIYANRWQKNGIAVLNAESGALEGLIDLTGLQEKAGQKGDDNILNGIAYDVENDRLFVTGKRWNKLFEIKLIKK